MSALASLVRTEELIVEEEYLVIILGYFFLYLHKNPYVVGTH